MQEQEALKTLTQLHDLCGKMVQHFKPELDSLYRIKWNVEALENERKRLQATVDAIKADCENQKAAAAEKVKLVEKMAQDRNDIAAAKLREADKVREDAKALLLQVKKFCNSIESREYRDLADKVKMVA